VSLDLDSLIDAIAERVAAKIPRSTEPTSGPVFLTRRAFGERVSLSPRTVDSLIAAGMPCIGRGRLLRVDVVQADAWLRVHLGEDASPNPGLVEREDEVTTLARRNAERGR